MAARHDSHRGARESKASAVTRRAFLETSVGAMGLLALTACSPAAQPASPPTAAPKPTEAPAPKPTTPPAAVPKPTTPPAAAATAAPAAPKPATAKVRAGYFATIAHVAPLFIGKGLGYYQEEGIDLEPVEFGTANTAIPALVTGELQALVGLSVGGTLYNALAQQPGAFKLVAGCITVEPADVIGTFVRKDVYDAGVKTPADLKGRTVFMPARGGAPEYSLAVALQKHGLTIKDINISNLPGYPEIYQGLESKTVELGVLGEPYASQAKDKNIGLPLAPYGQYIPGVQLTYAAFSKALLGDQREVGVRFLRAYLKTLTYYEQARKGGPNRAEAIKHMQAGLKGIAPEVIDKSVWYFLGTDGKIDVDAVTAQARYFTEQGFIKTLLPTDQVLDTTPLADAARRAA